MIETRFFTSIAAAALLAACDGGTPSPGDAGAGGSHSGGSHSGGSHSGGGGGTGGGATDGGPDAKPATLAITTYRRAGLTPPALENPAWIAFQDGDGAWTAISGSAGLHQVPITDAAGRWGVAVVCSGVALVTQATLTESSAFDFACTEPETGATDQLTISFAAPATCAITAFGNVGTQGCGAPGVITVPTGAHDLVGFSLATAGGGAPLRAYAARDLDVGGQTVDFNSTMFSAAADPVAINTAGGPTLAQVHTESTTLIYGTTVTSGVIGALPDAIRRPRDIHVVTTLAGPSAAVHHYFRHAVDIDDTALPAAPPPEITSISAASVSWKPYLGSGFATALGPWKMAVSAGWLAGKSQHDLPSGALCAAGCPVPCPAVQSGTPYAFMVYRPVQSFAASLPDIVTAQQLPTQARDGLTFSQAAIAGQVP